MQPLSPGRWDHTVCPPPPVSWQDPEFSPVQRSAQPFSPTPRVGPGDPSRLPQPLCSYFPWFGSLLLQGNPIHPPKSPTAGRRTPLPCSSSFSLQPTPVVGVRPGCEENHERSRKVWAGGQHLSLTWDLHNLWQLPSTSSSPITSAPVALLWISHQGRD